MLLKNKQWIGLTAQGCCKAVCTGVLAAAGLTWAAPAVIVPGSAVPGAGAAKGAMPPAVMPVPEQPVVRDARPPADLTVLPQCKEQSGAALVVEVPAGKSKLLNMSEKVTKLTIGNDGVAHAKLISPTSLYLYGTGVGSTNMILLGSSGRCTVYDVVVQLDPVPLRATIESVYPDETGLVIRRAGDGVVLAGTVSNAVAAQQIEAMARAYVMRRAGSTGGGAFSMGAPGSPGQNNLVVNMMNVAAPQQVMLEVKVAEVSKTVLDQFGINFSRAFALADGSAVRFLNGLFGGQGLIAGSVGGGTGSSISNAATSGTVTNGQAGAASLVSAAGSNASLIGLDAQKQDGIVKILAEPTVMAISGQEGSFLAGGKIFIPVVTRDNGSVTYTLEEKEFGVSLRFRPTVLADGRINLQVNPEVSELSSTGVTIASSTTGGTTILPAFSTRKAATTVQLFDGQSFAIGGLMKSNATGNVNAFPFLGEIPVLGALFRSHEFKTDRSELVFVITPRLVKPLPPDYPLPTDGYVPPNRWDLYGRGKLERGPEEKVPSEGGFEPR
jgi:pilus assembly protein CpaC